MWLISMMTFLILESYQLIGCLTGRRKARGYQNGTRSVGELFSIFRGVSDEAAQDYQRKDRRDRHDPPTHERGPGVRIQVTSTVQRSIQQNQAHAYAVVRQMEQHCRQQTAATFRQQSENEAQDKRGTKLEHVHVIEREKKTGERDGFPRTIAAPQPAQDEPAKSQFLAQGGQQGDG
jgi:hypothetical protein